MIKKLNAFIVFGLAILFGLFFQFTKHNPVLRAVNVFGEDPYDAVGSFGVLLAFFASVLSILWAVFSKRDKQLQSQVVVILSVLVTLFTDAIALIRYQTQWVGSFGGQLLAALTTGLAVVTVFVGWITFRSERTNIKLASFKRMGMLLVSSVLILLIYPTSLRQSVIGEIWTIIVGMVMFFVLVREGMKSIFPNRKAVFRSKLGRLFWVILVGILLGAGLFFIEALSEGIGFHLGLPIMLITIFIGAAGTGSILCYLLLSEYLGI